METIELNGSVKSDKMGKFFLISLIVIFFESVAYYFLMKTPVSEFSQNILKTYIFTVLAATPFYSYLFLFRMVKKKDRIRSIKQIMAFFVFSLAFVNFAFFVDSILIATSRDIEKIPANIFCFLVIIVFIIIQNIFIKSIDNNN
ncbi:hypothetical protein AMD27_16550 (plasmid) [Acinetobacter sp. TGL-Y2]|uniref:hypothetical protein n=1 Tax=Acinetobacter sp. TGL-Y2 TaxID=1407071 RepID=UPI0007A6817B|nr:hypothetical protein [Acinetobacter sp. TGL-Y2]AMW80526.1 hypothetical protein AMD27_16550 [Acinetobacter sp. TGL-Y2]